MKELTVNVPVTIKEDDLYTLSNKLHDVINKMLDEKYPMLAYQLPPMNFIDLHNRLLEHAKI